MAGEVHQHPPAVVIPGSRSSGFLVNATAWLVVQATAGYVAHRLPDRLLSRDGWLFRQRRVERGGRLYERLLRVRRWNRFLPEARGVYRRAFAHGRRRRWATDEASLRLALEDTRRAELTHWLALTATPLFVLWNPPRGVAYVAVYATVANVPCIVSQRYNRIRLGRLLGRRLSRR